MSRFLRFKTILERFFDSPFFIVPIFLVAYHLCAIPLYSLYSSDSSIYSSSSISWAFLNRDIFYGFLCLLGLSTAFLARKIAWSDLNESLPIHGFCIVLTVLAAWKLAFYDYNLYFNRLHLWDRTLVLIFAGLLIRSPRWIGLYVLTLIAVDSQFASPLGEYFLTDRKIFFDSFVLLYCRLLVYMFLPRKSQISFLLVLLSFLGAQYLAPVYEKLQLGDNFWGWPMSNNLGNLVFSSYVLGWFGNLSSTIVLRLAAATTNLSIFLQIGTLISELAPMLFLVSLKFTRVGLIFCILLHLGIGLCSGIFFWKWGAVEVSLLLIFRSKFSPKLTNLYTIRNFLLSVFLMLGLVFGYFTTESLLPVRLGWFDSRVNQLVRIKAVTESGRVVIVPLSFFAPYEVVFSTMPFDYLVNERVVVGGCGAVTADVGEAETIYQSLEHATVDSIEVELERLKRTFGVNLYDPVRVAKFRNFIKEFFRHSNQRPVYREWLRLLRGPLHIYYIGQDGWLKEFDEKIKEVQLYFTETFFDGNSLNLIREELIDTIVVEDSIAT